MNVYIVLCEENDGYGGFFTSVDKVFFEEERAVDYAKEMNKHFSCFRHYVEEREVE